MSSKILYEEDAKLLRNEKMIAYGITALFSALYMLSLFVTIAVYGLNPFFLLLFSVLILPICILGYLSIFTVQNLVITEKGLYPPIRSLKSVVVKSNDIIHFENIDSIYLNNNKQLDYMTIVLTNRRGRLIKKSNIQNINKLLEFFELKNIRVENEKTYLPGRGEI